MSVIGIDLGGTKIASALFNDVGDILLDRNVLIENKTGTDVGSLIIHECEELMNASKEKNDPCDSIGVSVPGIAYANNGNVWAPNIPGWENYPLKEELLKAFKDKKLSIQIESDRSCYILGEKWKGNAQDCKDAIYLSVGTGIGAGILVNGEILRGSHGIAGAVGWLALSRPYQDDYRNCGDFEYHASGNGIAKLAKEMMKVQPSVLHSKDKERITSKHIIEAADVHDPVAQYIIQSAIEYWGKAIANLVSIFNPEKIILGGGVFGPGLQYLDAIGQEAKKWAQPISMQQVVLTKSGLDNAAGLYGAAYLALQKK